MTGPHHYKRAEEILAEIEATNAVPNEADTALAIQAQAHAILAPAAATAIDPSCQRRLFRIEVPQGEIDELRRRINATRWPTRELVTDRSQGVQLAVIQNLARYWTTEYDWRRCEARLNALPQFKTEIDGLDIHFIHVGSAHKNALPLIMTYGWPGSRAECRRTR